MGLERRIALFTSVLVLGLLVCLCVTVSGTIMSYEQARLGRDLGAAERLFADLEATRLAALETETKMLADLPQLRAVMGTQDAPTIVDALEGFRAFLHADFIAGFDPAGRPYDPKGSTDPLVKLARESAGPVHGYVLDGTTLRQTVAVVVRNGAQPMGTLVAGYGFGEDLLGRLQAMTRGEFAVVGPTQLLHATPAARRFIENLGLSTTLKTFGAAPATKGDFIGVVSPLTGRDGQVVARLLTFRALSEGLQIAHRLRTNMILLSMIVCFMGIALSVLFARSISRPLRRLSERLAKADPCDPASVRQLSDVSNELGADRDVQSLLTSFSQLVRALATEREHSDEGLVVRAQELEAELRDARDETVKFSSANRRLLELLKNRRAA